MEQTYARSTDLSWCQISYRHNSEVYEVQLLRRTLFCPILRLISSDSAVCELDSAKSALRKTFKKNTAF